MSARILQDAPGEIARLVGSPPPVMPVALRRGTRATGRWINDPFEGYLAPLADHVIAAVFEGQGDAEARVDGKRIRATSVPGGITIAPCGHDGHWRTDGRVVASNVFLTNDVLLDFADQVAEGRDFELLDRVHHPDPKLFGILKLISDEIERPEHESLAFMDLALDLLCQQLIRGHSTLALPVFRPQRGLARWKVRRVLQYMRDRMGSDVTLNELAGVVCMSRFHFCTAFHAATGSPPHAFLTRIRMKAACALLVENRLDIRTIAVTVGYSSPSAFSAAFRKAVGTTPRAFRASRS